ncbi:mechanosensitive ion channel family protein [Microbacterium aurum]
MDLSQLLTTGVSTWDVVFAVLSVAVGWVAAHYARKGVLALAHRVPNMSEALARYAARFVYYLILLLGVGVALAFLGANVQPLLGIVIIAVVVAVLVLRGVADNFAAGVLIQTRQTVTLGDEITVEGPDEAITGVVTDLNSRSILLRTVDGRTVHVPNSRLLSEPIVNHSTLGRRRSEIQVRVERAGRSVDEIVTLVAAAVSATPSVLADPAPTALVTTVAPDRVVLSATFWLAPADRLAAASAVVRALAAATDAAGWPAVVTLAPPPAALPAPTTL